MTQITLIFNTATTTTGTPPTIAFEPAAGVTFDKLSYNVTSPAPAGRLLGTLRVSPSTWVGMLSAIVEPNGIVNLTGSGCVYQLSVGDAAGWVAGGYTVTVTSVP